MDRLEIALLVLIFWQLFRVAQTADRILKRVAGIEDRLDDEVELRKLGPKLRSIIED